MAKSNSQSAANYCVGAKQTKLAIENGEAVQVFIASDADVKLTEPIAERCRERGIPLVSVVSMRELGRTCGIQVGASAAAMIRE